MIKTHNSYTCPMNSDQIKNSLSYIRYAKKAKTDTIALHINNNYTNKITLPLGLLGFCETY